MWVLSVLEFIIMPHCFGTLLLGVHHISQLPSTVESMPSPKSTNQPSFEHSASIRCQLPSSNHQPIVPQGVPHYVYLYAVYTLKHVCSIDGVSVYRHDRPTFTSPCWFYALCAVTMCWSFSSSFLPCQKPCHHSLSFFIWFLALYIQRVWQFQI